MAPRPKANAKVAAGMIRRREFLESLSRQCVPTMVVNIEGRGAFARSLHADGLINMGTDTTSITAAGREWLANYG